jgi:hypothetical protein
MKATLIAEDFGFQGPCTVGAVIRSNGESTYCWALFYRKDIYPKLIKAHNKESAGCPWDEDMLFDLGQQLTGWGSFSNGIGRSFGTDPHTKIGRNHILVTQYRGLDI